MGTFGVQFVIAQLSHRYDDETCTDGIKNKACWWIKDNNTEMSKGARHVWERSWELREVSVFAV